MFRIAIPLTAALVLSASGAMAGDFTVTQGGGGKELGSCSNGGECTDIRQGNPGWGESVVNNQTGEVVNKPGRSDQNTKPGQGGPKK